MINVQDLLSREEEQATAVYAVADIHGCVDLLNKIEALIAEDIARHQPARPLTGERTA